MGYIGSSAKCLGPWQEMGHKPTERAHFCAKQNTTLYPQVYNNPFTTN